MADAVSEKHRKCISTCIQKPLEVSWDNSWMQSLTANVQLKLLAAISFDTKHGTRASISATNADRNSFGWNMVTIDKSVVMSQTSVFHSKQIREVNICSTMLMTRVPLVASSSKGNTPWNCVKNDSSTVRIAFDDLLFIRFRCGQEIRLFNIVIRSFDGHR